MLIIKIDTSNSKSEIFLEKHDGVNFRINTEASVSYCDLANIKLNA